MFTNTLSVVIFTLAILSLNHYQAEAVQCYTCTSYLQACADPIDPAGLQYQIEPNCQTSCYVYTSGGVTYRGCSDGLGCFDPRSTTTGTVTCGGVTYNLCNTNLCNTGSGVAANPTVATSTFGVVTTPIPSTTDTTASICATASCADCSSSFVASICPVLCTTVCATTLAPTTTDTTTTIAAICASATCADCTSSFVANICPALCLSCPTTPAPTTTDTTTTTAPLCATATCADCSSSFVFNLCTSFCLSCPTTPAPTTTVPTTTIAALCATATCADCISSFVVNLCTAFCASCGQTTTFVTTTTTPIPTTTINCVDDPSCAGVQAVDCASSYFLRLTCQLSCGTCTKLSQCVEDSTCSSANPVDCSSPFVSSLCPILCNSCNGALTTVPTTTDTTTVTTTFTTTDTTTITTTTDTTTVTTTTDTTTFTTLCPVLPCQNSANFNGITCQCDCVDGTSGTLCEILDCTYDSLGATTCVDYMTNYAICSDPASAIYCIATCNLCASTVPATTVTTTDTTTVTTPCPQLACTNSGNFNGATCMCDCLPGTSGTLCEILDCTYDNLGTATCVDYQTNYAICADPVSSIYCIATCNLCATTTQTTAVTTTDTTTITTPCPQLACTNSGNFNGATCQCDCIQGTSGTLCEILDCTYDNLGTATCVDYQTNYAICADPVSSIYCIATCNLCQISTTPVTPTPFVTTTTVPPVCGGLTCLNGGILDAVACTCDCSQITLADNITPRYSGVQCEIDATPCVNDATCGVGRQFPPSACGMPEVDAYCPAMCAVNGC